MMNENKNLLAEALRVCYDPKKLGKKGGLDSMKMDQDMRVWKLGGNKLEYLDFKIQSYPILKY